MSEYKNILLQLDESLTDEEVQKFIDDMSPDMKMLVRLRTKLNGEIYVINRTNFKRMKHPLETVIKLAEQMLELLKKSIT